MVNQLLEEPEIISIEKMCTIKSGAALSPSWNLKKRVEDIQMYEAHTPITPSQYGFVINNIHVRLPENNIGFIIPFDDDKDGCWECGGQIMFEIMTSFKGKLGENDIHCWCYNPKFVKSNKNMQFPYVPEYDCVTEMLGPGPSELIHGGDYDGEAIIKYARHKGWDWYGKK